MNNIELRKNPKPWLTENSITFIEKNLRSDDTIIEFGGGWSSIWFSKRVKYTMTVEANPEWASFLIKEMMCHPELMSKWSLKFVPSDWNPTIDHPKPYWKNNLKHLTEDSILNLTSKYLTMDFDPSVVIIDGSVRPKNIEHLDLYIKKMSSSNIRMIIIDNMETLNRYTINKFDGFSQYDFHETNESLIPSHQNGKWCTSVWIKN